MVRSGVLACGAMALVAAAVSTATCSRREPRPPERFEVVADSVVRDTRTGLEWTRVDSGKSLAWSAATDYCRDLELAGRKGWRLPEIAELEALFDKTQGQPCNARQDCRVDPALDLTDPYFWSASERTPGTRFYIDFQFGSTFSPGTPPNLVRRVLCVRSAT